MDGDCSHEIKRRLLLGRMTNLDSILKSRDIILPTKVRLVKAMAFPVVMYGCEVWTIKKTKRWRTDAFELWCWRRLFLECPWTARRSSQSFLEEINAEYSLEGVVLKLKFQYFGHLIQRADSLEKTRMLEKIEGRRRGWQMKKWLDGITEEALADCEGQGSLAWWDSWGPKSWTWLSNWTKNLLFDFPYWLSIFFYLLRLEECPLYTTSWATLT